MVGNCFLFSLVIMHFNICSALAVLSFMFFPDSSIIMEAKNQRYHENPFLKNVEGGKSQLCTIEENGKVWRPSFFFQHLSIIIKWMNQCTSVILHIFPIFSHVQTILQRNLKFSKMSQIKTMFSRGCKL